MKGPKWLSTDKAPRITRGRRRGLATGISRYAGGLTEGTALAIACQITGAKGSYRQLRSFDALPNLWLASFR